MKKVFIVTFMLVGLSAVSFAEEVNNDLDKKHLKEALKNVPLQKEDEVDCVAGMTSCGEGYMYCGDAIGGNDEIDLWMWEDFVLCGFN
ncbi:hypothetical protein [Pedobacter alpinus]|uniref:NVEALA protein n=1 Tax=Pedobacter alpinus TaxID=1590643 RepID=A0ABW5TNT1_9SPHI